MRFAALASLSCFLLLAAPSPAPTGSLARIHAALVPLQAGRAHADMPMRGATPAFAPIRRQLRDWIDAQILALPEDGDVAGLQLRLNRALDSAGLLCQRHPNLPDRCADKDGDWNATGYLGEVTVERSGWDRIVVAARMGILCGMDASVYAYEWRGGHWMRFWDQEQPIVRGKDFVPRNYVGASIAENDPAAPTSQLILSLGSADWCSSNWRPVYFTLSRAPSGGGTPTLLLDTAETNAFQGAHDVPIRGATGKDDALIEFTQGSRDADVHSYEAVRHYSVVDNMVKRIDPIALGPRNFVEEWLAADWREAAGWSAAGAPDFGGWHRKFEAKPGLGDFAGETTRCAEAGLWQIGAATGDDDHPGMAWFVVRWTPPYVFRMVSIANQPRADCAIADPDADAYRTLFPVGDWYQ